jgi:hypothetical protein
MELKYDELKVRSYRVLISFRAQEAEVAGGWKKLCEAEIRICIVLQYFGG